MTPTQTQIKKPERKIIDGRGSLHSLIFQLFRTHPRLEITRNNCWFGYCDLLIVVDGVHYLNIEGVKKRGFTITSDTLREYGIDKITVDFRGDVFRVNAKLKDGKKYRGSNVIIKMPGYGESTIEALVRELLTAIGYYYITAYEEVFK